MMHAVSEDPLLSIVQRFAPGLTPLKEGRFLTIVSAFRFLLVSHMSHVSAHATPRQRLRTTAAMFVVSRARCDRKSETDHS